MNALPISTQNKRLRVKITQINNLLNLYKIYLVIILRLVSIQSNIPSSNHLTLNAQANNDLLVNKVVTKVMG